MFARHTLGEQWIEAMNAFDDEHGVVAQADALSALHAFACAELISWQLNLLAVEVNRNVVVQACEKAKNNNLSNLRFMVIGAEKLEYFLPENSIEMIYLNHSCPFPKKRQAKHRLTHEIFLEMYKRLLKDGGIIRQKTDNMHFFEFSLCEFSKCGYLLNTVSLDLHKSGIEGNIVTEYEKRFSDLGQPIYYLEAQKR